MKNRSFNARAVGAFSALLLMFLISGIRLMQISSNEELRAAASNQQTGSIKLYDIRGDILDKNQNKITGASSKAMSIVMPTPEGITSLSKVLEGEALKTALDRLAAKKPILVDVDCNDLQGTFTIQVPIRYSENQAAAHVIGYLNNEKDGVFGIEKVMNNVLKSDKSINFSYKIGATGEILPGDKINIDNLDVIKNDVVLSLDMKIQKIAETALKNVPSAAVVVTDAKSNKISAMASVPNFSPINLSDSLEKENAPFINRAITTYSVGSVFKPCIATAAIESGYDVNALYTCKGHRTIGDINFNCHNLNGHGPMNMQSALCYSCNTYFYNTALSINPAKIHSTAKLLGYNEEIDMGFNYKSQKNVIPSLELLKDSQAAVANFAIGQGDLMLSPLAITSLYSAIYCGGKYYSPTIFEGIITENKFEEHSFSDKQIRAMSSNTASVLKEYLIHALDEGTGVSAKPDVGVAGGKTATAETGRIVDNRKILNGWFCGFFELKNHSYIISVLIEDIGTSEIKCASIFKEICESIANLIIY